jgi:transcriptional regulator with XRE-family HTH domain
MTAACTHKRYTRACPACQRRARAADERQRRAKLEGRHVPPVPADVIRPRLQALRDAGMACTVIGDRAGVDAKTVQLVLNGYRKYVMGPTAAALLAVRPDRVRRRGVVAAIGSARRLQALHAEGWTFTEMAKRSGLSASTLRHIAAHQRDGVVETAARKIAALFDDLYAETGPSVESRRTSAKWGWHGPQVWLADGAIDDPQARPQVQEPEGVIDDVKVEQALRGSIPWRRLNGAERILMVREHLPRRGVNEFARVMGISGATLHKWQARASMVAA